MEHTAGGVSTRYYFQRNLQGDVRAIVNTSGTVVARYLYDAFGNCTVASGTTNAAVANANPIRYRGYYYDDDTGLYYCNARYYSPKWRRFISPDDTSYLDPESVNGLNLYCYCGNDPNNAFIKATYQPSLGRMGEMPIIWPSVVTTNNTGCSMPRWLAWVVSGAAIVGGVILCATGVGGILGGVLIGAGAGSLISGYVSEANGGSFFAGYIGGAICGALCAAGAGLGGAAFAAAAEATNLACLG